MPEQTNVTTPTPADVLLGMLKIDLGISVTTYDARLAQYLTVAESDIKKEGATTLSNTNLPDMQLIVMYAAWMWRKRDLTEVGGMPTMLRYKLNNRIFQEKMAGGEADD